MRRLLVVGGIVAACLAIAAVAYAANNTVTYSSKLSPAHPKPKAGKPANIGYEGILSVSTSDGTQPDSGPSTVLYFAKQFVNNGKKFPGCTVADIDGKPAIPAKCKAATVGAGTASSLAGVPGTPSSSSLAEALKVTAINGTKGELFLVLNATSPVPITNRVIPGKVGRGSGQFGYTITFNVPVNLQNVGGLQVALTHFDVKISPKKTVKVKGKKVSYLQLKSCPSNHKLPFKTVNNFGNVAGPPAGPPITTISTIPC